MSKQRRLSWILGLFALAIIGGGIWAKKIIDEQPVEPVDPGVPEVPDLPDPEDVE